MTAYPRSDFERHGLASEHLPLTTGRLWLLTIDFEAFRPETVAWWAPAMRYWARWSQRTGLRFSFFVSVEDVARLRVTAGATAREEFASACRSLDAAGSRFHPHNHCVFDPETAHRPGERSGFPRHVEGYPRFPSMVYDVRRRNGQKVVSWLPTVVAEHERFLADAGLTGEETAFRAGGWDVGVSRDDMEDYLDAMKRCVAYESSALYGERDGTVGTSQLPVGRNVFHLGDRLVEVAPTDSVNCGSILSIGRWSAELLRAGVVSTAARRPGVRVTVIHFDHLFHTGRGARTRYFTTTDERTVNKRIDRFFRSLVALRRVLRVESCTYGDLRRRLPDPLAT